MFLKARKEKVIFGCELKQNKNYLAVRDDKTTAAAFENKAQTNNDAACFFLFRLSRLISIWSNCFPDKIKPLFLSKQIQNVLGIT